MNIREFMVGDWVICQNLCLEDKTKVISSYSTELTLKDFASYYNGNSEYVNYEPIPLTKEILEKNGFVKGEFSWSGYEISEYLFLVPSAESEDHQYELVASNATSDIGTDIYISDVHELQRFLKLRGIKKKIIL